MRPRPAGGQAGWEAGSVSLELVLLTPLLVLLAVFVLWAGRVGRVALMSDLAATEAATAAALCCEGGEAGAADREQLVRDVLESRPGLAHLCIGGVRPGFEAGAGAADADDSFVSEHWMTFEAQSTGGVGVVAVQFDCETDGAVVPLRGLLPTATFSGHAAEIVARRPGVGFSELRLSGTEGDQLTFVVSTANPVPSDVQVRYEVTAAGTAATDDYTPTAPPFAGDYTVDQAFQPAQSGNPAWGWVTIPSGTTEAEVVVDLAADSRNEGTETLTLTLTGLFDPTDSPLLRSAVADIDPDRATAIATISDP